MEKKRNKGWREAKRQSLFRRQLKLYASYGWMTRDGSVHHDWNRLKGEKSLQVYKSVRRPCSCYVCKGERYDRMKERKYTAMVMKVQLEE